jgi:hypothetical protein
MRPEDVNSTQFKPFSIIYNDGEFAIAIGKWENNSHDSIAARWNGEQGKNGYPNNRNGIPCWFLISDDLKDIFLVSLLNSKHSNKSSILKNLV